MARIDWNADSIVAAMAQARTAAISQGAIVLQRTMRRTVSGPSPSSPGSPPGWDRGGLHRSIVWVMGSSSALVGSSLLYSLFLEKGTKYGRPVPVPVNDAAKRMLRNLDIVGGSRVSLKTKNLQFINRKGKPPLLIELTKTGREKKNGAVFVIKRHRIAARPWVAPSYNAAQAEMAGRMKKAYAASLQSAVAGAITGGGR